MAKLYTRTGDDGSTGLFDGSRVGKDDLRVTAYGEIDELNAQIGLAAAMIPTGHREHAWDALRQRLERIQNELFTLGAELATPASAAESKQRRTPRISEAEAKQLEGWIDEASSAVPPLTNFVLPGGSLMAAHLHICRTVCRRAERAVVTLGREAAINPQVLIYLNRLSDLLFAWARLANTLHGLFDTIWANPLG